MPTVDYKPLANDVAANVVTQVEYLVLLGAGGALEHGFQDGVAKSEEMNKTLRQVSVMVAALANMISDALVVDVPDDGNVNALKALLQAALLTSAWSTGDGKITMKTVADAGWVMMNDGTIGSAASAASTRANADCQALFLLLWTNVSDTFAPVVGGRGANAAADWAANRKITLTKQLGRAIGIAGTGAGLTLRALGETFGEEKHQLTIAELARHNHDDGSSRTVNLTAGAIGPGAAVGLLEAVPFTGNDEPHNTMQPTAFWNVMIKL